MTASTVHVSNIAHNTTTEDLQSFFSFCGKITNLSLTPSSGAPDSPLSATITFERSSAASTAVLLDGTPLHDSPLSVSAAHTIDEIAGSHIASPAADGSIAQEDKPRTAILAEYLASGYVIGDTALQRGIELDKKHQLTHKFASYLTSTLQAVESRVHVVERAQEADKQYHVSEKATGVVQGLGRYFEKALETGVGQRVRKFYVESEKEVLDIHNEAKRLADLKLKEKKKTDESLGCTCEGSGKECSCKPGSCTCEGCGKSQAKKEAEEKASTSGQVQHALEDLKLTAQDATAEKV